MICNLNKNNSYSEIQNNCNFHKNSCVWKKLSLNQIVQTECFKFFHDFFGWFFGCNLSFHWWILDFRGGWFELISQNDFLYNRVKRKNCSLHITGSFIYLVNIKTQILSDKTSLIVKTQTNREVTDLICHQPSPICPICHPPSWRSAQQPARSSNKDFIKCKIMWLSQWRMFYLLNC